MSAPTPAFSEVIKLMTSKGFIVGDEVNSALYWATRVTTNLSQAVKYDPIRRKLQAIIWTNFRVISADSFAIDARGVEELALWLTQNTRRLSESQMVDGRQFVAAVDKLVDLRIKTAD
jgi:hypothetical protein